MDAAQEQTTKGEFNYTSLPDSGTHIRLIRVRNIDHAQRLDCELSTWPTAFVPSYIAISYTWGDAANTNSISINEQQIKVLRNCEYALRQAYNHESDQYIWIDALCINQHNTEEKSVQVAMMGQIFAAAEKVLACVGPYSHDSEYFMRILRRNERLYASLATRVDIDSYMSLGEWNDSVTAPVCLWLIQRVFFNFTRFRRAHNHFLRRPYFTRLWVVQELFMAKRIVLCCGNDRVPFELLSGHLWSIMLLRHLRSWYYRTIQDEVQHPKWSFLAMWLLVRRLKFGASDRLVAKSTIVIAGTRHHKEVVSMRRNLRWVDGLECDDPRDVIYATLSLVDWRGKDRIHPDYNKSHFQLALDVLEKFAGDDDELGSKQLIRWLVHHLQLSEQVEEIGNRVASLSPSVPSPSMPDLEEAHTRYCFPVEGLKLVRDVNGFPLGVPCHTEDRKGIFLNECLNTTSMQEGDYVLRRSLAVSDILIVARESENGRFELTGYTCLIHSLLSDALHPVQFDLYLDAEDLLVFELLDSAMFQLPRMGTQVVWEEERIPQLLLRRVCRHQGSSYAVKAPLKVHSLSRDERQQDRAGMVPGKTHRDGLWPTFSV